MSNQIIEDIEEFLKNANFTSYEISAYISLLKSGSLNARDLSIKSGVPTGRIYEVLDALNKRKMIEIQDSRPKEYRALSFNLGFQNLIKHIESANKNQVAFLVNQAKVLENKIYDSDEFMKKEDTKLFWSTAFGWRSMFSLYQQKSSELQEELLVTGFLNERTIRIIRYARELYDAMRSAYNRGVKIKYLWSFDLDERALTDEEKERNIGLSIQLKEKFKELYRLPEKITGFEMRFVHRRIPTYYDIFDKERILIKLRNPLSPFQIFACINVFDIKLAEELRRQYLQLWNLEAFE